MSFMAGLSFHANPPPTQAQAQAQATPIITYHNLFSESGVVSESEADHHSSNTVALARSTVPLGPFTGYAAILKRSSFLRPAQQLLDELFGSGYPRVPADPRSLMSSEYSAPGPQQSDRVNSRLIFMLQEVCKRCKLYCQQIESVVTSFEAVAGLGNAAPYIGYAITTISNHFGSFKNLILTHLRNNTTNRPEFSIVEDRDTPRLLWTSSKLSSSHQLPTRNVPNNNNLSTTHSVWQSRRGLPDHAVLVLKKWLFEHFLHPYPTDSEKEMLAQQTGLSRTQVSNWFINSRVRLWKPMVEEINALQIHKIQDEGSTCTNNSIKRLGKDNFLNNTNSNSSSSRDPRSNSNMSGNSATLALEFQPSVGHGHGPSQPFYRPINRRVDDAPSLEAGFKNWF